jgi:MscS family membrane protein
MQDFLRFVFWGNTLGQWFLAALFILGGLSVGKLCSLIVSGVLGKLSKKTKFKGDDILFSVLGKPLALLVFLGGLSLALGSLAMPETVRLWANRGLGSLFIILVAHAMSKFINQLILEYLPTRSAGIIGAKETEIQPVLEKFASIIIWLIAGALILRTLGYNISALMAGLGLGGAAIALASKDTLANFFGSITVFVDRPFKFNERIKIAGYDGVITQMGLRTSRLRTMENRTVIIPNSIFAANPIENVSAEPNTKVSQSINIRRDNGSAKISRAVELLREIGSGTEGTSGNSAAGLVGIQGVFCQLTFVFFVAKGSDYLKTVNAVNLEVLQRFEEEGILIG